MFLSTTGTVTQTVDEDYYSYPEAPHHQTHSGDRPETGTYQALELDSLNYTSMYSSLDPNTRKPAVALTTERDGHVYAVADTNTTEPPHQYASLKQRQ